MDILAAQLITGLKPQAVEIKAAYSSDLMSDVLSFCKSSTLLLTGLTNPQSVRTAEMSEIAAVCFVHGKHPPEETVELARKNGIALLATPYSMFTACGKLYAAGLVGCNDQPR